MVQIIKEVLLFVTLHTYLLQAQGDGFDRTTIVNADPGDEQLSGNPSVPANFQAYPQRNPDEHQIQFYWDAESNNYDVLKVVCVVVKAKCPPRNVSIPRTTRGYYTWEGFVAGAQYKLYVYTELMNNNRIYVSPTTVVPIETFPAPLELFNISYVEVEDTNNIQSTHFTVKMQMNFSSNRVRTINTTLYHIETLFNRPVELEVQSLKGKDFRRTQTMTVNFLKDDEESRIDHPLPGHNYKFVQEVHGKKFLREGPEAERFITMPPFPPKDLTQTSSAADTIIALSWKIDSLSLQDKIILKICRTDDKTNCVKEISLLESESDEIVPTKANVSTDFDKGKYIAYAIAQSNGVNSSHSNSLQVLIGVEECLAPENLNGNLTDVSGKSVSAYLSDGSSYSLACDTGYSFAVGDGEVYWTCGDNGEWIGSSKCTEEHVDERRIGKCDENGSWIERAACIAKNQKALFAASGGIVALALFISLSVVFIRCTRKKKHNQKAAFSPQRFSQQFSRHTGKPLVGSSTQSSMLMSHRNFHGQVPNPSLF